MPTNYRGEINYRGLLYHSRVRETRELAAAEVTRLLGNPHWQRRLSCADIVSCSVRVVEVDRAAIVHPLAGVSLESCSEALRRRLYDQVVADYFAPQPVGEEDEGYVSLPYTPEVAGLTVFYFHGRWFVAWSRLELEHAALEDRSELLRIYSTERGFVYHEV